MAGGKIEILVEPDLRTFPGKLSAGLKGVAGFAGTVGKGLGIAVAAGTLVAAKGLKDVITLGNEYTANLNELQAVSGATAVQMRQVGTTAKALGADMSLPATSAADAALAMVALAKGGLSVDEAMKAAKGTLQLAAAAQIDAAGAAEIQSASLNAFGLAATDAGHVADVLANTANAAAGSITDIANSMKYVGPIARSLGISIDQTAGAIGLLANNGIKSEQAGTSLRSMLASLASPSAAAAKGLKALGIQAFDNQGKFVGLHSITDQLSKAKKKLTDQTFQEAAANAFGNEALSAVNALANEGAASLDAMTLAVGRQGGAAEVAAAKTKGLGGAWEGFKSQVETASIGIYEAIAPPLEKAVRKGADFVDRFGKTVVKGLNSAVAAGEVFGPRIAASLASKADAVGEVAGKVFRPIAEGLVELGNSAVNIGITIFKGFAEVLRNAADAAAPLARGIRDAVKSLDQSQGPVAAFQAGLQLAYDAAAGLIKILTPVAELVGGLVGAFGDLPGPVQTAAIALLALKAGPAILGGLKNAFRDTAAEADGVAKKTGVVGSTFNLMTAPVRIAATAVSGAAGSLRQFGQEAAVQRGVAANAGIEIGRIGAAASAFNTSAIPAIASMRNFRDQTAAIRDGAAAAGQPISVMGAAIGTLTERSPALSAMRESFNNAADGADRFGRIAGTAAAGAKGIQLAVGGLVGALGGPWGLALAGAAVGLSLLAGANERAAQREKEHETRISSLSDALRESKGAIDESIRSKAAAEIQNAKLGDSEDRVTQIASDLGINLGTLTDAYLGNKGAIDEVNGVLDTYIKQVEKQGQQEGQVAGQNPMADKAAELKKQLQGLFTEFDAAAQKQKALDDAIKNGRASMLDATGTGKGLADAMKILSSNTADADTKARALKDAMNILAGGTIDTEAAQARLNESMSRLQSGFDAAKFGNKEFVASLVNSNGTFNIATDEGRKLRQGLQDIASQSFETAQRVFDTTGSLEQAKEVVAGTRQNFINFAASMGISTTVAAKLADQMGLMPDKVEILMKTPGSDNAKLEMVLIRELINKVPGDKPIQVRTLSDEAKARLIDLGFIVKTLPDGRVEVIANTAAAREGLNSYIASNQGRTITVNVVPRFTGSRISAEGWGVGGQAKGGILQHFAQGGTARKLTPMRGGYATVVPPNSWRVVGDRLRDDEAYIPINRDSRSIGILDQTASRMGFALLRRYAQGGLAATGSSAAAAADRANVSISMPVSVQDNRSASEFAQVASAQIAWKARSQF